MIILVLTSLLSFCAKRNLWRENYLCCLHKMRTVPKPSSDFWQPVQRLDQTSDRPSMPVKRAGESCRAFKWRKTGYKIAMQTVSYQCSSLSVLGAVQSTRVRTRNLSWRCITTTPGCCSRGGRGGVLLPHATQRACCLRRSVHKTAHS